MGCRSPGPGAETETRRRSSRSYAALDLGTNNCRLLIAEPAHFGFRVVDAFSRIVRLGEGLGPRQPSQRRCHRAHHRCPARLPRQDGGEGCVARAPRRHRGLPPCRERPRLHRARARRARPRLEIVDRKTEAYLAVTGCASLVDPKAHSVIVFDIGGGSTEIAWLDGQAPHAFADPLQAHPRLGFAARRRGDAGRAPWRHRCHAGKLSRAWSRRSSDFSLDFALVAAPAGRAHNFHLLGTSGTVTTVGGIHLGLAALRPAPGRRDVDAQRRISTVMKRLLHSDFSSGPRIPASARNVPIWFSQAAPFWKRSGGPFPRIACASRIADCAKES